MMFSKFDFYDRISEAGKCGIDAIEFWKWSNKDIGRVCERKEENGLSFSVFNIDSRNEKLSYDLSRGILNAGRKEELLSALEESIPVYHRLKAHAMIVLVGESISGVSRLKQCDHVYNCLKAAAATAEESAVTLVVEPLNSIDRENYFMPYTGELFEILEQVDSPNIKMLYDIYHQNMMGDFSLTEIEKHIGRIGHFHVADCPGRHEPGTGNVDYPAIIREIAKLDYSGYIGLEYRATKPDAETLGFIKEALP